MQQFGVTSDKRMHTTRLKQKLLAHFPAMQAQSKGRDIMLVFDEDIDARLVSRTMTVMLHRLFVETFSAPSTSLGRLKKIARQSLCHTSCLH